MAVRYIIAPYHPEVWSVENIEQYGKPESTLDIDLSLLDSGTKKEWNLNIREASGSLSVKAEIAFYFSIIDNHILTINIETGNSFCEFVHLYRSIVPSDYELYLFREGSIDCLEISLTTTISEIQTWTGLP